jgi:hypothetical protein
MVVNPIYDRKIDVVNFRQFYLDNRDRLGTFATRIL